MKRALAAALLLALALPCAAAPFDHPADAAQLRALLGPVTVELQHAQSLRGTYVQRKTLPELPRPLIATGDFLFVRDNGIRWRTVTPFASELVITTRTLVQRDGGSEVRVSADRQPAIRMIGRIFISVFSLDFDALSELFVLSGERRADGGWSIGLVPRQSAGSLKSIEVDGSAQVERVVLREGEGDLTEIELHDARAASTPASDDDLAPFAN